MNNYSYITIEGICYPLKKINKKNFESCKNRLQNVTGIPVFVYIAKGEDNLPKVELLPAPHEDLDYILRIYFKGCYYKILNHKECPFSRKLQIEENKK